MCSMHLWLVSIKMPTFWDMTGKIRISAPFQVAVGLNDENIYSYLFELAFNTKKRPILLKQGDFFSLFFSLF